MGPGKALSLPTPVKTPAWSVTTAQIPRLWEVPGDVLFTENNQIMKKHNKHQLCVTEWWLKSLENKIKSRLYSLDDYHQPVVLQEVQRVLRVMGQKMTSDLSLMLSSLQCSFFSGWIHTELYVCKNSFVLESLGKCSSQMELGVEWIAVLQAIHLRNALRIVHSNHTMWLPWVCVYSWTVRIPHPPGWSKISM